MIDVAACTAAGVLVVNNSGANAVSVAQHAMGQMLCLMKQIAQTDKAMRRDPAVDRQEFVGMELTGKTLGIIGLGNIGRRVAAYAHPFGMDVIAFDPYLRDKDFTERGAQRVSFNEVFERSDVISLHCPLTAETRHMIGRAEFQAMKPSAYFQTTARGGIVDEAALVDALNAGEIAGAAVDVLEDEPNGSGHPLSKFENVLLSPHNAGITHECNYNMAKAAAEQWQAIFSGARPPRLVNPEAWPAYQARYQRITGEALKG